MALGTALTALSLALLSQPSAQPVRIGEPAAVLNAAAVQRADIRTAIAQDDPAQLISIGVALARSGETAAALELLNAAARSETRYRLETAEGDWVDSRRLAMKVIGMIDRGEFAVSGRVAAR